MTNLEELRTVAWTTAGARYNAARRLQRREVVSTASLALLSALTIFLAFVQRLYVDQGSPLDNYLTALSVGLGIFLLAISLIEWGGRAGAKAEQLHANAEALNAFQRRLASTAPVPDTIELLVDEYEAIKAKCRENHSPLDLARFRADHLHAPEFTSEGRAAMTPSEARLVRVRFFFAGISAYLALLWPIVVAAIIFPLVTDMSGSAQLAPCVSSSASANPAPNQAP